MARSTLAPKLSPRRAERYILERAFGREVEHHLVHDIGLLMEHQCAQICIGRISEHLRLQRLSVYFRSTQETSSSHAGECANSFAGQTHLDRGTRIYWHRLPSSLHQFSRSHRIKSFFRITNLHVLHLLYSGRKVQGCGISRGAFSGTRELPCCTPQSQLARAERQTETPSLAPDTNRSRTRITRG